MRASLDAYVRYHMKKSRVSCVRSQSRIKQQLVMSTDQR